MLLSHPVASTPRRMQSGGVSPGTSRRGSFGQGVVQSGSGVTLQLTPRPQQSLPWRSEHCGIPSHPAGLANHIFNLGAVSAAAAGRNGNLFFWRPGAVYLPRYSQTEEQRFSCWSVFHHQKDLLHPFFPLSLSCIHECVSQIEVCFKISSFFSKNQNSCTFFGKAGMPARVWNHGP